MNFNTKRMKQLKIQSLAKMFEDDVIVKGIDSSKFIYGPSEFDCLVNKWSRGEVTGVIGDSGTGKTEFTTYCAVETIKNGIERGIISNVIFISLEMTTQKLGLRLFKTAKGNSEILDKVFIISRYDEEGKTKQISLKYIKEECIRYKELLGDISLIVLDHCHVLGENDPSTLNSILIMLKELAVELNSHVMALAQVNKGAGQKGEVPLDADAFLGGSQFKFICSDIMQIHRPVKRMEHHLGFSVFGYGYCKIREPDEKDGLQVLQNRLLKYDLSTRSFQKMTNDDYIQFKEAYNELLSRRTDEEKSTAFAYDITKEVKGPNGKVVVIDEIFAGDRD